jgi:hypothetical protein
MNCRLLHVHVNVTGNLIRCTTAKVIPLRLSQTHDCRSLAATLPRSKSPVLSHCPQLHWHRRLAAAGQCLEHVSQPSFQSVCMRACTSVCVRLFVCVRACVSECRCVYLSKSTRKRVKSRALKTKVLKLAGTPKKCINKCVCCTHVCVCA